ncbi:alpha/beta hydrolase fold domain-containing protein [Microlunatus sp. Gsoil 973]|jgi:acetyl esterase|uniref:alpha/beta hydrolase fold domain-containing protein n=1 Tax=Microlunatus sp. Gsoil 973 TaxID=2672569 RepID=UPI0012B4DEC8|nr:alpha/beta hydrolase [Microlunatus sp. Gsoil 973]QGN35185.1 alpha/beta hydrolase fold domain-containing protein [Microlunatus sp. Gsoil 973]
MTPEPVQLDPADPMARWLTRIAEHGAVLPGLRDPDPAHRRDALRQLSDRLAVEFAAPAPDTVRISDEPIERPDGSSLRLRRYLPERLTAPFPTQLWCHGGGFLLGTVDEVVNDRICAARAEATGLQIISVDIRQAPEHRYPAGVHDLMLAYDTALTGTGLSVDEHRLGLGGVSSGGFTAAVAALRIRDRRGTQPVHLALESPMLAFERSGDPSESFASDADLDFLTEIVTAFLPPQARDEYALPMHIANLAGLPPTLVVSAEFDPLRDSAERFGCRLRDAGNVVTMIREPGHLHGSSVLTAVSDRSRAWQAHISEALRAAYRTA